MKKLNAVFGALMVATMFVVSQGQTSIRITNGEWPPYLSDDLPFDGVASRIVTDAFALKGVKVEYGFFPWKRSLLLAQNGEWDGAAVWLKNAEREKDFYISDPVIESQYVFFHLNTYKFDWNKIEDLKGIKIGATLEYDYGETFTKAEKDKIINVERVPSDEMNLRKIIAGRIDIFPVDLEVGFSTMQKAGFTKDEIAKISYCSKALRSDPLHLMLSRKVDKNKDMIVLFNAGLKELKESGKVQQYINEARGTKK